MAETLREQQLCMRRFIRDPHTNPAPPGIEARRLAVYRQLILGSMQSLLSAKGWSLGKRPRPDAWCSSSRVSYHSSRAARYSQCAKPGRPRASCSYCFQPLIRQPISQHDDLFCQQPASFDYPRFG